MISDEDILQWHRLYRSRFGPDDFAIHDIVTRAAWLLRDQPEAMNWVWQWRHCLTRDMDDWETLLAEASFRTMWKLWRAMLHDFVASADVVLQSDRQRWSSNREIDVIGLYLRNFREIVASVQMHTYKYGRWQQTIVLPRDRAGMTLRLLL
jgi:hypothetical protein